jgi:hypothetical protein
MLNQATNQNVAQGAGMLASTRGITTAQAGRQAAQGTAQANQAAASNGAVMRANQQLQSQGLALGGINANLGINQAGATAQNQAISSATTSQQGQGASIAGQNAQASQGLIGGILGTFNKGGEVKHLDSGGYAGEVDMGNDPDTIGGTLKTIGLADGGYPRKKMADGGSSGSGWNTLADKTAQNVGNSFSIDASKPSQTQNPNTMPGGLNLPSSGWQANFVQGGSPRSSGGSGILGGLYTIFKGSPQTAASATNDFYNNMAPAANMGTVSGADLQGGMGTTAAGTGGMAGPDAGAAAASSGAADAAGAAGAADAAGAVDLGAAAAGGADAAAALLAAKGGMINAKGGGQVPGKPMYPGRNTEKQDNVPALLTSKEIVLPLTVTQSANPAQAAFDFVSKIKGKEPKQDFKGAISRAAKQRKSS